MTTVPDRLSAALADRYRIERELGQGGMATVYLAEDLKHRRKVAIKVLRPELAAVIGAERFLHEIRTTAQLSHPNILPLLDSGDADGLLYYVTPYIEGASLRDRLRRGGALGLEEALGITRGAAAALDYAHRHGVVHRDIKPENILLQDGQPVVADFGISLAVSTLGRDRLTETGLSLGTPSYMSPEQASAEVNLDGRSDEYSLASVLYEMLAGEAPYTGPNARAIVAKQMTEPVPRLTAVRDVPPEIERAIVRALAKNPTDRFPTVGEFGRALALTSTPTPPAREVLPTGRTGSPSRRVLAIASAALMLGILAALGWYLRPRAVHRAPLERQITFTGHAYSPELSRDGKWIAYITTDSLMVQEISGGAPVLVFRASQLRSPRWSPDGTKLLVGADPHPEAGGFADGVYEVPRLGGEAVKIIDHGDAFDYSPNGARLAVSRGESLDIVDRQTGTVVTHRLVSGGENHRLRWSPDGHWIAVRGDSLKLVSVEGQTIQAIGGSWNWPMAWGPGGRYLLYLGPGSDSLEEALVKVTIDKAGKPGAPSIAMTGNVNGEISVSADGRLLLLSRQAGSTDVYTASTISGGSPTAHKLTSGTYDKDYPVISPDGQRVAWIEYLRTDMRIMMAPFEGIPSTVASYRQSSAASQVPTALEWGPNGRDLGYVLIDSSGLCRIVINHLDGRTSTSVVGTDSIVAQAFAWGTRVIVAWSKTKRAFIVVDLISHRVRQLPLQPEASRSPRGMYAPVLSPDGTQLIASRSLPNGYPDDLWQIQLDGGEWKPVVFPIHPNNLFGMQWDRSGLYVGSHAPVSPGVLLWRAAGPSGPFKPYSIPVPSDCSSGRSLSLSEDHRRMACLGGVLTTDIWLIAGFDPDGQ